MLDCITKRLKCCQTFYADTIMSKSTPKYLTITLGPKFDHLSSRKLKRRDAVFDRQEANVVHQLAGVKKDFLLISHLFQ
jgi:hypothetical protein